MKNCRNTSACAAHNQPSCGAVAALDRQRRDHEEGINEDVEVQGWEDVAGVVVGPEAELDRDDDGSVHKEEATYAQHACRKRGRGMELLRRIFLRQNEKVQHTLHESGLRMNQSA
jgi:hypothetical protein